MDYSKLMENEAIKGKESELEELANSQDAERIKNMIDSEKLQKALDNEDTEALKSTVASILQTKEGTNILSRLEQLFK